MKGVLWKSVISVTVTMLISSCGGGGGGSSSSTNKQPADYYAAFPTNMDAASPALSLLISGAPGVQGTVECPGLSFSTSFTTDASGLATIPVPPGAMLAGPDEVENKGVIVHADDMVSVVAVNDIDYSMGAYTIPPASALGTEFYMSPGGTSSTTTYQYLAIVATADGTTVTITPRSELFNSHAGGVPYDILLNRGQVYQTGGTDIAAVHVKADHPIAVYGGHMGGNVPAGAYAAGFMATPFPPIANAGAEYFIMPFETRSGYWIRLIGLQDATDIAYGTTIAGAPLSLNGGQVAEFYATGVVHITATKPLVVVQMAEGGAADSQTGADPCQTVVMPVSRYAGSYTFSTPTNQVDSRYVNLVIPASSAGNLKLNGTVIGAGSFSNISTTGYSTVSVNLPSGVNRLTSDGTPFGALVYGWAPTDGYNGFCFTPGVGF